MENTSVVFTGSQRAAQPTTSNSSHSFSRAAMFTTPNAHLPRKDSNPTLQAIGLLPACHWATGPGEEETEVRVVQQGSVQDHCTAAGLPAHTLGKCAFEDNSL